MGDHVPSRRAVGDKRHKKGLREDSKSDRGARVSFKRYVQELEEELMEQELEELGTDQDEPR